MTDTPTARLLTCGYCYEEQGEEVHPHPECPMSQPDLTDPQKAYNVAQSEMFQLAAYGHHRYHPSGECLTDEGRRQQRNYLDRIRAAREELEAALLHLVAEKAESFRGDWGIPAAWLRSLANDPAAVSLLAVRPDELPDDAPAAVVAPPTDRAACDCAAEVHMGVGFYHQPQCAIRRAAVLGEPTDRAAALLDAADRFDRMPEASAPALQKGITWATSELRRLATEAQQQAETEAPVCGHVNPEGGERCGLEQSHDWHRRVVPLEVGETSVSWAPTEAAPVAQQPATEAPSTRCPSCDHEAQYHDADGRCWFTVDHGVPGSNLVCPCAPKRGHDEEQQAAAADCEETSSTTVSPTAALLATRCDACLHTLQRHENYRGCTVVLCVCSRFQMPDGDD